MSGEKQRNMWGKEALAPRMIVLLILLVLAAGLCIRLGYWQLERATSRGADRIAVEHEERLGQPAEPLHDVLRLQTTMTSFIYASPVYATGTYEPDQLRVIDRSVNGQDADLILSQLVLTSGPDAGGNVPVVRGWVPAGDSLPPVPEGEVTVFGYLSSPEDSIGGLTEDTALSVSSGELANAWGSPILSGYLVEFGVDNIDQAAITSGDHVEVAEHLAQSEGVNHATPPKSLEEGGFNLQNAAYAAEWVIFAGFALFIWYRVLRGNVIRRREDELLEEWEAEFLPEKDRAGASAGSAHDSR